MFITMIFHHDAPNLFLAFSADHSFPGKILDTICYRTGSADQWKTIENPYSAIQIVRNLTRVTFRLQKNIPIREPWQDAIKYLWIVFRLPDEDGRPCTPEPMLTHLIRTSDDNEENIFSSNICSILRQSAGTIKRQTPRTCWYKYICEISAEKRRNPSPHIANRHVVRSRCWLCRLFGVHSWTRLSDWSPSA